MIRKAIFEWHRKLSCCSRARERFFRIQGEINPEEAAANYENTLQSLAARFNQTRYTHDLILVGLGPDGHTASLFPGTAALQEKERNVVSNFVPKWLRTSRKPTRR
jgi:6-phosphogluconolactonase